MYGEKIAEVVRTLIKINKSVIQSNDRHVEYSKVATPVAYAKEFKTVKVSACRGAGHSYSVHKIAYDLYHDGNKVLVLSPKFEISKILLKSYPGLETVCAVGSANKIIGRGRNEIPRMSGIVVDVSSMISPSIMNEIYQAYAYQAVSDDDFFFVLLE